MKNKYKYSFNKQFYYPSKTCITDLASAINSLPGIDYVGCNFNEAAGSRSCKAFVSFSFDTNVKSYSKGLFFLTRCTDRRYWEWGYDWSLELSVGDTMKDGVYPVFYTLTTKRTHSRNFLIRQIKSLINNMNQHLNHENFMKEFDLDINDFDIINDRQIMLEKK